MPPILSTENARTQAFDTLSEPLGYEYPEGLDLRPGSTLHNKIRSLVLERARDSRQNMKTRVSQWNKIENSLTAYVPLSESERRIKAKDSRTPVTIVVPVLYATVETILTYWVAAFMKSPLFSFTGTGPEDMLGAALLEQVIDHQAQRNKMALDLYTQWRDSLVYGFGVIAPVWEVRLGKKTISEASHNPIMAMVASLLGRETSRRVEVETTLYEGGKLNNIDPYCFLPDPNVPVHKPQSGEFVGWVQRTNLPALLSEEKASEGQIFNVRYLRRTDYRKSTVWEAGSSNRDRYSTQLPALGTTQVVDVINMYVNLIPKDWGLSEEEYPEKWLFSLAADDVIIRAQPLGMNHNMFPIAVMAPNTDGYSVLPTSMAEVVYGLQETVDWMVSAHTANVRKALNDMFIVDPLMVNMADLQNPEPGKLIRLRQGAWGRGVENVIKQFPVSNVTEQHIKDLPFFIEVVQRVTGAVDIVQGIFAGGERKSAEEARGVRSQALSRLEKTARLAAMQSHHDIASMLASNTQQFKDEEMFVRVTGQLQEVLQMEMGVMDVPSRMSVRPEDLLVEWDVLPADVGGNAGEDPQIWIQLLQQAASQPELAQRIDILRVFLHAARISGAKNIQDFVRRQQPMQMQVASEGELESGNVVPLAEAENV